ncbi:MAG TPA: tRNA (guanosine(46)-N7)-methyltransferase TrmB [Chthoniobacterales bacterium]|nr:tRNA (guanosine(46)-N7)-methyltransferase TrmB [Chthoniobacterales bacterium]
MAQSTREILVESYLDHLDLAKIFGRIAPLQVDLGCGDGWFLFQLAEQYPEKNFLGIERLAHRIEKASRKANKIGNMRVLRSETAYAVEFLLPPESVETFHLLFPDPWPKHRHHRRRIVTNHFLSTIHRTLAPNGILRIATDHLDYFQQIERLIFKTTASEASKFDNLKRSNHSGFEIDEDHCDFPMTRFEMKFRAASAPIYRLSLRKISLFA